MSNTHVVFVLMVFAAVSLLAYSLFVPTFGQARQERKRLKKRLRDAINGLDRVSATSLVREKYLRSLSPFERWLESLPGMAGLSKLIEQAGRTMPANRLVLISMAVAAAAGIGTWLLTRQIPIGLVAGVIAGLVPFMKIAIERVKRLGKFEEQLPEALDTMTRALRAGHPFNETLHLVGQEMDDPIAKEFETTFADINYGNDPRVAFLNLLERVPSVNLMVLVTSVLIQRETGGNLTEVLEKISALIRSRFRFQRRVRTLSAEGRMSAWILALVPFVLFAAIYLTTPDYLTMLTDNPMGMKLVGAAFVNMAIGMFWMRRIIRIQV